MRLTSALAVFLFLRLFLIKLTLAWYLDSDNPLSITERKDRKPKKRKGFGADHVVSSRNSDGILKAANSLDFLLISSR
jgi:hypothetical protein